MKKIGFLLITLTLTCCTSQPAPDTVEVTVPVEMTVLVTQPPLPTYTPYPTYTPVPEPTPTPAPTSTPTLEAVQPADARASAYVGGNASPSLAEGEPGAPSVVAVGLYTGSSLPVVLRNNTLRDVVRMSVSAVAHDADDNMLGSGGDQGFKPNLVGPGEITLGYVYFGGIDLPDDATFEFEVTAKPASEAEFENIRDLEVIEQAFVDDRIVGRLQNSYEEEVSGPIGVFVACFDAEGALLDYYRSYTDKEEAEPGDTVPFQVAVRGSCPVFLVAASGFADF